MPKMQQNMFNDWALPRPAGGDNEFPDPLATIRAYF